MDNFRRRTAKKDRKITRTEYYSTNFVINSWNPPSEVTYAFGNGSYYVAEENITIYYDVYNSYDDGTQEYVRSTSWTGDITPIIITRNNSWVGQYTYNGPSTVYVCDNKFYLEIGHDGYKILKSDADGTQVQFELELLLWGYSSGISQYREQQPLGKVVLTKKGASGSGNVLARFESYV